ncbi:MAG: NAD-dependent epimerase/dehydratase family protein [Pirellulales bacterium]|nr:NAD-dependent epimerase/dehydratase family protein [Pirellulales bacterium]
MRVLVTGGGGFLGQYIVRQLVARGDTVRVVGRRKYPEIEALGVETIQADLRDRDATIAVCADVEAVIHTAGVAGIWGPWKHYYEINTLATEHVIEGCRQNGIARLVYSSSPSVTFDGSPQVGIDESAPYPQQWLCHYPHSKALAEQAVLSANGTDGLSTCALRPHLIWGPGDLDLVPRLITRAKSGKLRQVGDGTNLIDTVYVENAAEAHLMAVDRLTADSPVAGQTYFISQGEPVNCWDWIGEILEFANVPPIRRAISLSAAWRVGYVLETVHRLLRNHDEPRMTRFLAAQLATSHYFDISRARSDLGYVPKVSMEDGMRRLGRWLESRET